MLPADFDFSVLDRPSFSEADVREEMIAPIIRGLGFRPTGHSRVERGKTLVHPFVMLGTTKRKLSLVPDYLLYGGDRVLLVLDAKAPGESVSDPEHIQQAYSYAIHPEVRSSYFGLCNGRDLVVFEVATLEPLIRIATTEINARWDEVEKALHPKFLEKPILRTFRPDFGMAARRLGLDVSLTALAGFHVDMIARLDDATYTVTCGGNFGDVDYMASFDLDVSLMRQVLQCIPDPRRSALANALSRAPYQAYVSGKIALDVGATLGPLTQGEHEEFVPLLITEIKDARYQPDFTYDSAPDDVPAYVFQL